MKRFALAVIGIAAVLATMTPPASRATTTTTTSPIGPGDWYAYGGDARHDFAGTTSLTSASAPTLARAWYFQTGDPVTAQPVVVGDSVYAGSWDGMFYALDRATGALRWKFALDPQPAISPQPGGLDPTTDGGLVTASAWYEPGQGSRPDLIIFAGGFTLYALDAHDGSLYWKHAYTGDPDAAPDPNGDSTRIFSSPVVVDSQVIFGVSSDGGAGKRGYVQAADLRTGEPDWRFETATQPDRTLTNDGCGGVWSSPAVDPVRGLVYVGVADCAFFGTGLYNERVLALTLAGQLAWVFTPPRLQQADPPCDMDFGATVNVGDPDPVTGAFRFLGIGGKDGTYYSLDPGTGALRWQTNVVFGGAAGGFIGTTAFDGSRVFGATAFGDFPGPACTQDPRDTPLQEPSMHAFDAATGRVLWEMPGSTSFGSTTVAGGMTFVGTATTPAVQVRDAATGNLVTSLPLPANCFCGIVVAGNAVILGTGSPEQPAPDGIVAFTPLGAPPARP